MCSGCCFLAGSWRCTCGRAETGCESPRKWSTSSRIATTTTTTTTRCRVQPWPSQRRLLKIKLFQCPVRGAEACRCVQAFDKGRRGRTTFGRRRRWLPGGIADALCARDFPPAKKRGEGAPRRRGVSARAAGRALLARVLRGVLTRVVQVLLAAGTAGNVVEVEAQSGSSDKADAVAGFNGAVATGANLACQARL